MEESKHHTKFVPQRIPRYENSLKEGIHASNTKYEEFKPQRHYKPGPKSHANLQPTGRPVQRFGLPYPVPGVSPHSLTRLITGNLEEATRDLGDHGAGFRVPGEEIYDSALPHLDHWAAWPGPLLQHKPYRRKVLFSSERSHSLAQPHKEYLPKWSRPHYIYKKYPEIDVPVKPAPTTSTRQRQRTKYFDEGTSAVRHSAYDVSRGSQNVHPDIETPVNMRDYEIQASNKYPEPNSPMKVLHSNFEGEGCRQPGNSILQSIRNKDSVKSLFLDPKRQSFNALLETDPEISRPRQSLYSTSFQTNEENSGYLYPFNQKQERPNNKPVYAQEVFQFIPQEDPTEGPKLNDSINFLEQDYFPFKGTTRNQATRYKGKSGQGRGDRISFSDSQGGGQTTPFINQRQPMNPSTHEHSWTDGQFDVGPNQPVKENPLPPGDKRIVRDDWHDNNEYAGLSLVGNSVSTTSKEWSERKITDFTRDWPSEYELTVKSENGGTTLPEQPERHSEKRKSKPYKQNIREPSDFYVEDIATWLDTYNIIEKDDGKGASGHHKDNNQDEYADSFLQYDNVFEDPRTLSEPHFDDFVPHPSLGGHREGTQFYKWPPSFEEFEPMSTILASASQEEHKSRGKSDSPTYMVTSVRKTVSLGKPFVPSVEVAL